MNSLVVLLGPTGVGKTEVALQIAEHLQSPIINADSRQLFAEIPIGTAAPTKEQQERVKHYFVGTLHLTDYYSAAKYEEDVLQLLNQHFKHQQVALLSGGSMMYIDAVCQGIDDIPTVDEATRRLMKRKLETEGLDALVAELKVLDPEHYKIVDLHNPRRVIHALEICFMTGNTYTSYRKNTKKIRPFNIVKIGLNRPREEMYERINNRVLEMMNQGLIEEAKAVYPQKGLNALNTVGYKELFAYFDGDISLDDAILKIQSNTRQYMRKQFTWFKRDNQIKWFSPTNIEEIINYIDDQR
ncbi:MAG: tRNA (adenosine(37)-N6)-dimethylallyltransferase MiaA [Prevotella sp.]|nr:tRNA (adenosine(37)-N6)-dimethylallyltransferase MiaA [Prevotellaceae bacterium]MDY5842869.1 tRNA (adenosine(37)-N6)-dimethylallyltransferase MiaA [Prevotella sp.]